MDPPPVLLYTDQQDTSDGLAVWEVWGSPTDRVPGFRTGGLTHHLGSSGVSTAVMSDKSTERLARLYGWDPLPCVGIPPTT